MNLNSYLAFEVDTAIKELNNKNFEIINVTYMNQPHGNARVVRIKELGSRELEILASYEKKLF